MTLGLIHGSAPHAFVLCHLAGSTEIEGYPGHPLRTLPELVELHERIALPARPAKVAAIALNTRHLDDRVGPRRDRRRDARDRPAGGRPGAVRRRGLRTRCWGVAAADSGPLAPPPEHDTYYTWPGAQTLQVSVEPWGAGFVQNVPKYFIDCPFACIRPFDTGATVTLTATPTTGYTFVGWKVADHAQPADGRAPARVPAPAR